MASSAKTKPAVIDGQPVHRSQIRDAMRRFTQNRLAVFGLIVISVFTLIAIFADVIAPYGLNEVDFSIVRLRPFTDPDHILGADGVGRDYLTRLIYGARTSMTVGLAVPFIAFAFAVPFGAVAGYRGGFFDFFAMRTIEVTTSIPPLLFALFLISVIPSLMTEITKYTDLKMSSVFYVILVLALTSWVEPARIARAQFLAYREKDFVLAARALGTSERRIIFRHILPNAITPLLVSFTFAVPLAIFAEAGLSFLGIGITEPTASWGKMVGTSVGTTIQVYYWLAAFPTILVAFTMLSFSFVGDGLQDALDPARSR